MLEHEISFHPPEQAFRGVILRQAVRAVILRADVLLMIHSARLGDYKFPGGGVRPGEDPLQALRREVLEECGRVVDEVGALIFKTTEKMVSLEADDLQFQLVSHYYRCSVTDECREQSLDDYEAELGFQPAWVRPETALEVNRRIYSSSTRRAGRPRWLEREIWALENLPGA